MAETKEGLFDAAARAMKAAVDHVLGKKTEDTKLATEAQSLRLKEGKPLEVDAEGTVTSGQADGEYVLEDGSTATIKDGKVAASEPAPAADEAEKAAEDEQPVEAPEETEKAADAPEQTDEKTNEQHVTQADLKTVLDAIAALQAAIAADKEASKAELSAEVTKLSAELEEVKRQPAVGKQGAPTYSGQQVELSKMSVAARAEYLALNSTK